MPDDGGANSPSRSAQRMDPPFLLLLDRLEAADADADVAAS